MQTPVFSFSVYLFFSSPSSCLFHFNSASDFTHRLVSNYSYNTGQSAPVCSKSHRADSRLACASLGENFGGGGGTPSREECSRAMAALSPKSSPNSHKCVVPNFGRYADVPYSLIYQWQPTPDRLRKSAKLINGRDNLLRRLSQGFVTRSFPTEDCVTIQKNVCAEAM